MGKSREELLVSIIPVTSTNALLLFVNIVDCIHPKNFRKDFFLVNNFPFLVTEFYPT